MTNNSNLKINERSNVERPNLLVTTLENENREKKESKFIYIKGQISGSETLRVVRDIEWTNNFKILKICEFNKFTINLKLWKFFNFPIYIIGWRSKFRTTGM